MSYPPDELVQHWYRKAMALPPAARATFVAAKCRHDAALQQRLEAMLAATRDGGAPVAPARAGPLAAPPAPAVTAPVREGPGSEIGPYRLLQQLGEGGFGVVFLAEQQEPVQRQVALKILKLGMDTEQVVARFEQERQALAVMDHPHIAKVLDAGATTAGRPYFVMELCRGEPLTDYCDRNQLTIDERLALFEQICAAVQHAHGKGLIHRDLKPSNLLVGSRDGTAQVKVIDFGIAKVTQRLTARALFTEAQQIVGTLQYMSPEQAEGSLDIDTRTDVYSLGVILYELLTGSTPFERETLQGVPLGELPQRIRDQEPHRPSTRIADSGEQLRSIAAQRRVAAKRLPQLVRGELDWMVMKAIEKERSRRYPTAHALALDVARYRCGEAVEAAPPSAAYRLRKFLRRHRGPVAAGLLVLLTLLAGIAGTAYGMLEAKARAADEALQRTRADGERDRAVQYRNQALQALRATTGEDVELLLGSRQELTHRERAYLEAITQRWLTFSEIADEAVASRELRAEGLMRVALLRRKFDRSAVVRAGFEASLRLWQQLHDEQPAVWRYREELALGHYQLGNLCLDGDGASASHAYGIARQLATELAAEQPDATLPQVVLARSGAGLAQLLRRSGDLAAARIELERVRALDLRLLAGAPAQPFYRRSLAATRGDLAQLLQDTAAHGAALAEYREARELQRGLLASDGDHVAPRSELANTTQNIANLLDDLGQAERAEAEYRAAIDLLQQLADALPGVLEHQHVLARTRLKLGRVLAAQARYDECQALCTVACAGLQSLVSRDAPQPEWQMELARAEVQLAELPQGGGDPAAATARLVTARDRLSALTASQPEVQRYRHEFANACTQLAIRHLQAGRTAEAEAELAAGRRALPEPAAGAVPSDAEQELLGSLHNTLGLVFDKTGRREAALRELAAACALRGQLAARNPQVVRYQIAHGGSLCNLGRRQAEADPASALPALDQAVAVLQPVVAAQPRQALAVQFLGNSLSSRATANRALGRWAAVADDYDGCAALVRPADGLWYRQQRALARAKSGDVAAAAREAEALALAASVPAERAFAARVFACAAQQATGEQRQQCADRAMAELQQLAAAGRPPTKLADDPDFAALRERDDFRRLTGAQ